MGQFKQARQPMFSISEAYTRLQGPSWASLTRPGNPCFQFLGLILGLRGHHGPVNQARQTMSSISKAYTGPQRPSWASLTRPGNPCF